MIGCGDRKAVNMIQYYLTYRNGETSYWRGDSLRASILLTLGEIVIPLGNKKPKNVSRETLKEF